MEKTPGTTDSLERGDREEIPLRKTVKSGRQRLAIFKKTSPQKIHGKALLWKDGYGRKDKIS